MNDPENHLAPSGDLDFVDAVMRRIAARERLLRVVSLLVTGAAVALLLVLLYGLRMSWMAIAGVIPDTEWRLVLPFASIAVAVLVAMFALPSVAAR